MNFIPEPVHSFMHAIEVPLLMYVAADLLVNVGVTAKEVLDKLRKKDAPTA